MMKESRLIGYTTAQLKKQQQKARVTPTIVAPGRTAAAAQSVAQNANAATKGTRNGSNPNADLVERMVQEGLYDPTSAQQLQQGAGLALADARNYVADPGSNPARQPMQDPRNPSGFVAPGAKVGADRNMQIEQNVRKQYADMGVGDPVAINQAVESALAAETQRMTQKKIGMDQKAQATKPTGVQEDAKAAVPSPTDTMLESLKTMAANNPDLATFIPQLESILAAQKATGNEAKSIYDDGMNDLEAEDLNGDGVTDGVASAVSESKDILKEEKDESDALNKENRDIALEAAKVAKDMAEIEKAKFELAQIRNENLQREQNIEAEIKNRRMANRLGINADTNGLKWMAEEIRKGTEALSFLEQGGDLQSAQFALQIGKQYQIDVRAALNDHASVQATLDSTFRKEMESLEDVISMDAKERAKEKKELKKWYFEQKAEQDKNTWQTIKDYSMKAMEMAAQQAKDRAAAIIKTGDSLSFISQTRERINQNPTIKQAKQVQLDFNALDSAWEQSARETAALALNPDSTTRLASDQALITKFNKILDPTSVVREGEYARTEQGQALLEKASGLWTKYLQEGGTGLTPKSRQELYDTASAIKDGYEASLLKEVQPYLMDIDLFNSQANVQSPIDYKQVIDLDIPLPEQQYDSLEGLYGGGDTSYNTTGTENMDAIPGFLDPANAPPGGYRTDRHNNPTAFTVDVAKTGGLIEGVDYVVGDAFQGKGGTLYTAKLLGDGVATTVKAIDKMGFFTQKGGQRWTHTAIDKKTWDSMTYDQKAQVVTQMYQREGGTGVLVNGAIAQQTPSPAPTRTGPTIAGKPLMSMPQDTGTGLNTGGSPLAGQIQVTPSKQYRNNQTGAVITVKPGQSDPYASKPYQFTPIS